MKTRGRLNKRLPPGHRNVGKYFILTGTIQNTFRIVSVAVRNAICVIVTICHTVEYNEIAFVTLAFVKWEITTPRFYIKANLETEGHSSMGHVLI